MHAVMMHLCHSRLPVMPQSPARAAPNAPRNKGVAGYINLAHMRPLGYWIENAVYKVTTMGRMKLRNIAILTVVLGTLTACGSFGGFGGFAGRGDDTSRDPELDRPTSRADLDIDDEGGGGSIFDLFNNRDTETEVLVNRYLWTASLEVLNFLPVQSVDPFTGVIVTGFGTPPNGGTAYRATVLIDDPALDARSLNVALQSRGGPVSAATSRAVEDAILSRARELRVADNKF